jgi:hypothetical protein
MATVIKTTFQLKRGTSTKWQELNLILADGEPGFERDTNRLKIGNGKTPWNDLPYISDGNIINAATHYDFPSVGFSNIIYKAEQEKMLYQWNSRLLAYEALGVTAGEGGIIIDTELSSSSNNPIANSAVKAAVDELSTRINKFENIKIIHGGSAANDIDA